MSVSEYEQALRINILLGLDIPLGEGAPYGYALYHIADAIEHEQKYIKELEDFITLLLRSIK